MSEQSPRWRLARSAAVLLSAGLGVFVVVNAQVGCDAPAESNAPPAAEPTPANAAAVAPPEPEPAPSAESTPEPEANAANAATHRGSGGAGAAAVEEPTPVFMPASKSGGDFGAARFPGERNDSNAAPPTQQAQQAPPQP